MAPEEPSATATGETPEFSPLDADEVEEEVLRLGREGKGSAEIGALLRDQYAVPDVQEVTGRKITEILDDEDLTPPVPEDLANLMERALNLREHNRENPNDTDNRRALRQLEDRIRGLAKYYKEQGELPIDWAYSERTAEMVVE
jgi:small subunit ribosomal protein S15